MILNSGKTPVEIDTHRLWFESVVILNSGKTNPRKGRTIYMFESVVILDSGKTYGNGKKDNI